MVLVNHLGNREAGHAEQASLVLAEAAIKCDARIWPYPVIRYFRREISAADLLGRAGNDEQRTEAHT